MRRAACRRAARRCRARRSRRRSPRCRRRGRAARRRRWRSGRTPSGAAPARPRRPSRPRRSSRAARRAAARRSPAGPRSAVTRVPTSGPWATSSSHTGSSSADAGVALLEVAEQHRAHALRGCGRSRRGSSWPPSPRSPAASRGPAPRRRRGTRPRTGSPGTWIASSSSSSWQVTVTRSPSRLIPAPARASSRSVWSRLGSGSTTVVVPSASRPASSTQLLICAEATGSAYSIPCSGRPVIAQRREAPVARLQLGAHLGQRARDAVDGPAADALVAVERPARRRAARRASPAAAAAACRRCRRRSPRRASAARSPGPRIISPPSRASTSAPSARTASSDERVSAASR